MLSQDGNGRRPSFCKRRKQSLTIVPSFSRAMWRTKRGRGRTAGRKWRSRGAGRARSGARGGFRARRTPLQRSLLNKEEEMFRNKLISQRRKLAVVQKQYEMLLKEKQKRSRKRKLEVDSKCVQAKSEGSSNVDGAQPSSSTEVPLISEKPYSVVRRVEPKPILNPIATGTSIRPSQSRRPKQKDPVRDAAKTKKPELCVFFTSTGQCKRGAFCRYIHDRRKVRVCIYFAKNACKFGKKCPLRHETDKNQMPTCRNFLRGCCSAVTGQCPFAHTRVSRDAKICQAYQKGYCPKGLLCTEKHVWTDKNAKPSNDVEASDDESVDNQTTKDSSLPGTLLVKRLSSRTSPVAVTEHTRPRFALMKSKRPINTAKNVE